MKLYWIPITLILFGGTCWGVHCIPQDQRSAWGDNIPLVGTPLNFMSQVGDALDQTAQDFLTHQAPAIAEHSHQLSNQLGYLGAQANTRYQAGMREFFPDSVKQTQREQAKQALVQTKDNIAGLKAQLAELEAQQHQLEVEINPWQRLLPSSTPHFFEGVLGSPQLGNAQPQGQLAGAAAPVTKPVKPGSNSCQCP